MGVESSLQGPSKAGEEAKKGTYKQDAEMLRKACTLPAWQAPNAAELLMVLLSNMIFGYLIKSQITETVFSCRNFLYNKT